MATVIRKAENVGDSDRSFQALEDLKCDKCAREGYELYHDAAGHSPLYAVDVQCPHILLTPSSKKIDAFHIALLVLLALSSAGIGAFAMYMILRH